MATRTLEVQITGDPSKFNRSLGHVDTSVDRTSGKFKRLGDVGKKAFSGLAFAAGATAAVGLKQAADAAIEAEKTQARLEAQLKASGISYDKHADQIENVIGKVSRLSGLDDEDLTDSFTNIVRVTGNVDKSLRLTGLAADFARAKHMDVAKAGELVGKVAGGNTGILSRYGIKVKEGATAQEALGKLQEKFQGQAKAYGDTTQGAMDKASVAWENLLEIVGEKIAPVVKKAAEFLTGLFDKQSKGNKIIKTAANAYMDYLGVVRDVIKKVVGAVDRWIDKNRDQINDVIRAFKRVGNFIKDIVTEVIIPMIKRIAPIVQAFVERTVHFISNLVRLVTDLINGDWEKAWQSFKDLVKDAVLDTIKIVGRMWKALKDTIVAVAKKLGPAALDLGEAIIDGMVKGIKAGASKIAGAVTGVVKGAVGKAGDVASSLNPFGDGVGWAPLPTGGLGPSSLMGADAALAPFAAIGSRFGLSVTSGSRPGSITSSGNESLHSTGDAIDVSGAASGMLAFFNFLKKNYGSRLAELIHTPGGVGVKNGQPFTFTGQVAADHYDHVHVGYTGGIGDGTGHTGGMRVRRSRTGDGIGIKGINFSPAQIKFAVAAASASGLDPRVIAAWMNREFNGYRKTDTRGKYNFMSVGYTDSGDMNWLGNAVNDPTTAGRATGLWLTGKLKGAPQAAAGIQAIANTAGGSIRSQVQAIISSPWASGHYYNDVSGFTASARGISGFGTVSGGSPDAGGGGGGAATGPRAQFQAAQKRAREQAKGALGGARNEALTGGGIYELKLATTEVLKSKAERKDNLSDLIFALKSERAIKRARLKRIRKLLRKGRLSRKNRIALKNEEAQLIGDIGDLNDTIKEYKADQKGGATTITRAEELDAGVDPNAADAAADAGGGGADTSAAAEAQAARDAIAAELAELVRQQVANQQTIIRLTTQQGPQILAAVIAAVNGDIGGKVGLGFQGGGYYPGSTARY